jgi:hypothetical protein
VGSPAANVRIIGVAAGVIMAIIITAHMTPRAPTSTRLHSYMAGIAMPGIPGISATAVADISRER